ncbi:MAG: transcriptional regulator [Bacteroidetes bacterium]|nr:transcriptional regulator [Bacteroidota bacterium]MCB0843158.1 transcriptional regulator [Bacteroidota bacterium]MCB0854625.1 transcriptional regulator [Bacteroidota bacterium]
MQLEEAKEKFIQAWGALGSNWGINRTMAQVHALLLISPNSLSAQEVMDALNISRGNANMNLRALIDWGLVSKEHKAGDRKEYFFAEKDIWQVAQQVIIERRKRELKPVLKILEDLKTMEGDQKDEEVKAFVESVENIHNIVGQADKFLEIAIKADRNWFFGALIKMFSRKSKQE